MLRKVLNSSPWLCVNQEAYMSWLTCVADMFEAVQEENPKAMLVEVIETDISLV